MGLDMYLTAKRNFFESIPEQATIAEAIQKMLGVGFPASQVVLEVGYWRKANQVHNWFVKNCQEEQDDCRPYYVSRDQLLELLAACKQVIDNPKTAPEILPSASGFFFGGTEYDSWYFNQLENTVEILTKILEDKCFDEDWHFEYQASW